MFGIRYFKATPTTFVLHHVNGRVRHEGTGLSFFYFAPTSTLTESTSRSFRENEARAQRLLNRIKLGRFAEPSDLVGAAVFLASPASDFVTGHTLFVDGGWHAAG